MSCIIVENLQKSYKGRTVVNDVSFYLDQGEVVGLLGPNGAGKTTSFYMVVGLVSPEQGRIFLDQENITHYPMYIRARKGVGYLAQEPSAFRKLTVEENILAILETLDLSSHERKMRLETLLEELDILHLRKSKAYTLSGGERRRLEVTRALATNPSFILLDEPFAGIDPKAIADIQKIIERLAEKQIGILITDHNVRETLKSTDRAYIMTDGEIRFSGTPIELAFNEKAKELYLGEGFML
ncbi:putative lipopolysaccharide transport protein B, ATP-binding component of ABC superfamily [Candidatus Moduliflexus flocculans]|uniref:Putative lipopolysaccharide transport protein B, ATP-binding component of ABC superfamily n=1 Tax=Candidatus Moduliflexus flocculans TaxID=1499966 RepID=A0A0S6W387_9BACT|nr:putative lipopolysaccharide transport protein B, ATP-binding component of ABC superfamily [Candidatus Moduliflexus flocculans]